MKRRGFFSSLLAVMTLGLLPKSGRGYVTDGRRVGQASNSPTPAYWPWEVRETHLGDPAKWISWPFEQIKRGMFFRFKGRPGISYAADDSKLQRTPSAAMEFAITTGKFKRGGMYRLPTPWETRRVREGRGLPREL